MLGSWRIVRARIVTSTTPERGPGESAADPTTLLGVVNAVRKNWAVALATALAVTLGIAFYTLGQTKIYQATSTVEFDPHPPRPLGKAVDTVVEMGAGNFWDNREYYETQYKIVQSMRVATAVVRQLGLNDDATFVRNVAPGQKVAPLPVSIEDAGEIVRSRLSVAPIKDSRLAIVKYEDADAARAQRILAAILDTYVEQNLDDVLVSTNSAADWLRTQLDSLRGDLDKSEMALHDYRLEKNMLSVAFDDQSNMLREEIKQLNEALTSVQTKREEARARRDQLRKVSADDPSNLPASELLASQLLQQLRQHFEAAVRERESLVGGGKGSNHPDVQAADARVAAARGALLAEVRNVQGAVDREVAAIEAQESGVRQLFERAKKQALDLNLLEIEYSRLRRTKENTEKLYQLVLERTKESDLARMMRVNNIRVVDRPLLPRVPVRPRVAVNIALGLLVGIVLGVGATVALVLLDRTLKTPVDVENDVGVTCLGLLPEIGTGDAGRSPYGRRRRREAAVANRELIVHELPASGVAESARAIRTNLMFMAPDKPYRALLITSAGPAEGKTTVASCIAIAMAQAGQSVLLIDCDLRRPRIHRIFGIDPQSGVTTVLLDQTTIEQVVHQTTVPRLSVMAAGPIPPNPAELFHSARFKTLLDDLLARYDRVIIDSPPVVAVTDAAVLSTLVDGTVMVVRAFRTTKELARHGARSIADVGGKVAGIVLNAVDLDKQEYRYHYYYYRRDGYYSSTPETGGKGPGAEAPNAPA